MSDYNDKVIAEFRANGGHVESRPFPLLLLHTTGAKSGREHVTPIAYQARDGGWAVFASYAGREENPAWFHNLVAHPDVQIEVGTDTVEVHAQVLEGAERDEVWAEQKQQVPGFADYEEKTSRTIPVVQLTRR